MKKIKKILNFLLLIIKDVYITVTHLTKEDIFDIMEIISFGLVINSLYGLTSSLNLTDFMVLSISLYIALISKQMKRNKNV